MRASIGTDAQMSDTMKLHDAAKLFPEMVGDEFNSLVEDIEKNGLREPLKTYKGKLLDGRNRLKACQKLRIKPTTQAMS